MDETNRLYEQTKERAKKADKLYNKPILIQMRNKQLSVHLLSFKTKNKK